MEAMPEHTRVLLLREGKDEMSLGHNILIPDQLKQIPMEDLPMEDLPE